MGWCTHGRLSQKRLTNSPTGLARRIRSLYILTYCISFVPDPEPKDAEPVVGGDLDGGRLRAGGRSRRGCLWTGLGITMRGGILISSLSQLNSSCVHLLRSVRKVSNRCGRVSGARQTQQLSCAEMARPPPKSDRPATGSRTAAPLTNTYGWLILNGGASVLQSGCFLVFAAIRKPHIGRRKPVVEKVMLQQS